MASRSGRSLSAQKEPRPLRAAVSRPKSEPSPRTPTASWLGRGKLQGPGCVRCCQFAKHWCLLRTVTVFRPLIIYKSVYDLSDLQIPNTGGHWNLSGGWSWIVASRRAFRYIGTQQNRSHPTLTAPHGGDFKTSCKVCEHTINECII